MQQLVPNLAEILILLFVLITFMQSGIDKASDWNGNIGWLKEHFSKTFMGGMVPLMVGIIMILEIIIGLMAIVGIIGILTNGESLWALYACALACLTLLMLLFGQRVAKDYAGAFTLTGYFIVCVFGVYLLS
ncbi:DoxX family protein [Gramella sp. BOM4]|nr:DoxX family protein [Christiangramia bathymodioli]